MAGFSRGQGVPLHRGLHQLGASTNSNKMLCRLIKVACTGLLCAAELICFRTLAVSCIALQLTKSLSIVPSQSALNLDYSHPSLYLGLKRPRLDYTRVYMYYGLSQFIPRGILWPEEI